MTHKHVVVTGTDILGTSISGRGLRALGIAGALAGHHEVTLTAVGDPGPLLPRGVVIAITPPERRAALGRADVVITANELTAREVTTFRGNLVVDLYDPRAFQLAQAGIPDRTRDDLQREELAGQRRLWRHADIVVCATEQQRDFYLGTTLASLPVSRLLGDRSMPFSSRVVVVPSGIDPLPPEPDDGLRARLGFRNDDIVVVWGGALWDWMAPELLLEALSLAREGAPALRLLLLGVRREGHTFSLANRTNAVLDGLQRLGDAVVMHPDWIPPQERGAYLLASDASLVVQQPGLEAHFSARNRVVDSVWASLPIVGTRWDPLTDIGEREGWALLTEPGDVRALADALIRFASDAPLRDRMRSAITLTRSAWTWDRHCRDLLALIDALPSRARLPPLPRSVAFARSQAATSAGRLLQRARRLRGSQ